MAILKSLTQAIVATLLLSSAASALDTRAVYARPQAFRPKVARNHNGNNDGGVASLLDGLDLGNLNLGGLDNLLGLNSGSGSGNGGNKDKSGSSSKSASSLTAKQCVQLAADIASAAAGSNATAVANDGGNATVVLVASSHSAAITTSIVVTDAATTLSTVVATKTAAAAAKATATKAAAKQKRHHGGGHSNAQNSKDQVAAVEDAISQCASLGIDVTKGQAKAQQQADAASSKSNGKDKGHHGNDNNDNNNGNDGATIIIIDNKLKARNIWEPRA